MISISKIATDKKTGMTLADLRTFVQDCMNRDLPDDAEITARGRLERADPEDHRKRARQEIRPRVMTSSG